MIRVTRLDGTEIVVNVDQVTWIGFNPDTVINLTNGEKLLVRDTPDDIVARVREYKRSLTAPPVRDQRMTAVPLPLRAVE